MKKECIITKATLSDVQQLVPLINSAYRGEEAKIGWTHEADLIEGSIRIDEASLIEMIKNENVAILKCTGVDSQLLGCVYLEKQEDKLYLGMLSVLPKLQAGGIGKQLLNAAETQAVTTGCSSIIMHVIPLRYELIDWYNRNGYKDTGVKKPFPTDNRFGTPRQALEFVVLEKKLAVYNCMITPPLSS